MTKGVMEMRRKTKKFLFVLLSALCLSSKEPQVGALNESHPSFTSPILFNLQINGANKISDGSKTLVVNSAKNDWMTKTKVSWECLKLYASYGRPDPIKYSRAINMRFDIEINPERIPHKVDAFGFLVPSDCPRLKSFSLKFNFGNTGSSERSLIYTCADSLLESAQSKRSTFSTAVYNGNILRNAKPIQAETSYPGELRIPFYSKNDEHRDVQVDIPNSSFELDMDDRFNDSFRSLETKWIFNPDDKYESDEAHENLRMYAKQLNDKQMENYKRLIGSPIKYAESPFYQAKNSITFYYTLSYFEDNFPDYITFDFTETAEVGYGVIGSSVETRNAYLTNCSIKVK